MAQPIPIFETGYPCAVLLRELPTPVLVLDDQNRVLDANAAACRLYGYAIDRFRGLDFNALIALGAPVPVGLNTPTDRNCEQSTHRRADGSHFVAEIERSHAVHDTRQITLIVIRDISSRRLVEEQLHQSQMDLRAILDSADETVAMLNVDGTVLAINLMGAARYGLSPQQMIGRNIYAVLPADIVDTRRTAIETAARDNLPRELIDQRGGRWYHNRIYPISNVHDRVVIYARDITESHATEMALRAAMQVVEASPVVAFRWIATDGWPVDFVSNNVSRWGYTPEQLRAGQPSYASLVHPDDLARVIDEVVRHTEEGASAYRQEYRVRNADGNYFWVDDHTHVVRAEDGTVSYYEGVVSDIDISKRAQLDLTAALDTQRELNRKLEDAQNQLLQSEKMASIGQLAAGVAHELNNPIGFVHSNLGTLVSYLNDFFSIIDAPYELAGKLKQEKDYEFLKADTLQLLAESREGLERVRKIVQDLKDFSRVGESNWQWSDLQSGLESTLNIVWNELKYKCTVTKDYASLPRIRCLPSQLNQVFMNLLVNAAQAIPEKGEIHISTRMLGEDQVQVIIRDSGKGIPPDHLKRIFDPFFTTKPVGQGTGLGLSIAWGIIGKHHGTIAVDSTVGVGTTFTVTLPIDPPADQASAVPPAPTF